MDKAKKRVGNTFEKKDQERGSIRYPQGMPIDLQQAFTDYAVLCPYGMNSTAVYHQARMDRLTPAMMGQFFHYGYRRNGNYVYTMSCPDCSLCVPIRLDPQRFTANRNQRRVWKRNSDVCARVAPLTMSPANLSLLSAFLKARFPSEANAAHQYYSSFFITSMTQCFEIRYMVDNHLMGVAIVDAADEWLNAVYFFFDPSLGERSPGTYNILYLVHFCRQYRIKHLYLGYWLAGQESMDYKKNFLPHQLYVDDTWQWQEKT